MIQKWFLFAASVLLAACSHGPLRPELKANDQYGWVYNAQAAVQGPRVILVPQWHLSPGTNTRYLSNELPQTENQHAIYRQLVAWVESSQVQTVVVEGCEGEINHEFTTRFNGWGMADLENLSAEDLDRVVTNVGLKIKAKVGEKARVVCGDNLELLKRHQMILSDLRGLAGFKARIEQYKDDSAKRAEYILAARDILKVPKSDSDDQVVKVLNDSLRTKVKEFTDVLHQRNASFVRTAKFAPPTAAIVIGAIHIEDLQKQLKDQNVATSTFEPRGLKGDEAELLKQIDTLVQ